MEILTKHLCEHQLYSNAKKHLRKDGQEGWGNTYRTLLAAAGQSPEGWAAFRNAVLVEPTLAETSAWVRHWDADMTVQTARRASMPPHYSTGALDPHIAAVRQQLERRRWTFRNLPRMNALPGTSTVVTWWPTGPSWSHAPSPTSTRRGRPRPTTAARSDPGPRC